MRRQLSGRVCFSAVWSWRRWMLGVSWCSVADMPEFDERHWWECDRLMIELAIGPLTVKWMIDGPRRNVRSAEAELDRTFLRN